MPSFCTHTTYTFPFPVTDISGSQDFAVLLFNVIVCAKKLPLSKICFSCKLLFSTHTTYTFPFSVAAIRGKTDEAMSLGSLFRYTPSTKTISGV